MTEALAAAILDDIDITSMPRYVQHGYPWAEWDRLRAEAPVYWYEGRPRFSPFWAVTRFEDVRYVSSHPELFSNAGVIRLDTAKGIARQAAYKAKRAERHGWDPDVPLDMLYTDPEPHHRRAAPAACAGRWCVRGGGHTRTEHDDKPDTTAWIGYLGVHCCCQLRPLEAHHFQDLDEEPRSEPSSKPPRTPTSSTPTRTGHLCEHGCCR